MAAREDALGWGRFRSGGVLIAGTEYTPPASDELPRLFEDMLLTAATMPDIYDQAIHIFLTLGPLPIFL